MRAPLLRRPLVWKLYAFTLLIVFLTFATMATLPVVFGGKINERDASIIEALGRHLLRHYPHDAALARALVSSPELAAMELHVFDRAGRYRFGTESGPRPPAPSGPALEVVADEPVVKRGYVVVSLGPDRVLVHLPDEPKVPLAILLTLLTILLSTTSVATLWFARTIATPLHRLAHQTRAFGRGDTTARARLVRQDELGEVGRAFDDMADKLDQLLRTQRAMMADISHELRTPLTRIRIALELATADPAAAQQVLDDVGGDLAEIEQIIEDVFVVVQLDSAAPLRRQPIHLPELIARSVERFRAHHAGRALVVETPAVDADPPARLVGDPALVRRAVDNLLDNAAKYSPVHSEITLRASASPGGWTIDVVDRGIGMTTAEVAQAFTPFWRADESRNRDTGGVGLGLALARRVARAHGGDVVLSSQRAVGTTARITLGAPPPGRPA
jgi:signal transduction histidine kinase